jgi:hypothetical protein
VIGWTDRRGDPLRLTLACNLLGGVRWVTSWFLADGDVTLVSAPAPPHRLGAGVFLPKKKTRAGAGPSFPLNWQCRGPKNGAANIEGYCHQGA